MVRVEGQRGREHSDVGDERGVLQRGQRQEGKLTDFSIGRGGGVVWAVGGAGGTLLWWIVLLQPETHDLTAKSVRDL